MEPTTVELMTKAGFVAMAIIFTAFLVAAAGVVLTLLARKWKITRPAVTPDRSRSWCKTK